MKNSAAQFTDANDGGGKGGAREHGFALLAVLWIVTSATFLVATFNASVRSGTASAISEVQHAKLEALLDAGVEVAAAHLINNSEDRRWQTDGTVRKIAFDGAVLTISIRDPNGLVDLNKSDEKLLQGLFQRFTRSAIKAAQYADLIMHARAEASGDKDKSGLLQTQDGTSMTAFLNPTRLAFIDPAQLRSLGIPLNLFRQIAPFVTVYSSNGMINPATAPAEVLESVPDLNRADVKMLRSGARDAALFDIVQNGATFLNNQNGPAYIISVTARLPNENYRASRTFVIASGLDVDAPYRIVARRPMLNTAVEAAR